MTARPKRYVTNLNDLLWLFDLEYDPYLPDPKQMKDTYIYMPNKVSDFFEITRGRMPSPSQTGSYTTYRRDIICYENKRVFIWVSL